MFEIVPRVVNLRVNENYKNGTKWNFVVQCISIYPLNIFINLLETTLFGRMFA